MIHHWVRIYILCTLRCVFSLFFLKKKNQCGPTERKTNNREETQAKQTRTHNRKTTIEKTTKRVKNAGRRDREIKRERERERTKKGKIG